jgi:hypothetical protein
MSRRRKKYCECEFCRTYGRYEGYYPIGMQNNRFSFRYLIILILIILQFGQKKEQCGEEKRNCCRPQLIDNSILFIIALYFLSCCMPDCY